MRHPPRCWRDAKLVDLSAEFAFVVQDIGHSERALRLFRVGVFVNEEVRVVNNVVAELGGRNWTSRHPASRRRNS
jgi:hypothetical protein